MSDLAQVTRTVAIARRAWTTRELVVCVLALGVGCASALFALASLAGGLGALARLAAAVCGVMTAALAGHRLFTRVGIRGPEERAVAGWIESALPELRESLVTALERGPLSPACAEYAAQKLRAAPRRARLAAIRRGSTARMRLVGAAGAAVLLALCARSLPLPAERSIDPAAPVDAGHGEVEVIALPRAAGQTPDPVAFYSVVGPPTHTSAHPKRSGDPDASEVLSVAPAGFERAVELFIRGR